MRMITALLILIGLFVTFLLFSILKYGSTETYQGHISDHFNGKTFYNREPYTKKSTLDLLRWWFSRGKQKWPAEVINEPHLPVSPVTQSNIIKVTFINHSTVLLQTLKLNILTDPVWSYRVSPFSWYGPARVRNPGIAFTELPPIHIVLISHNHYDHLDLDTLKNLDDQFHPIFVVPLGNKALLSHIGIQNVVELDWWQHYKIDNANIFLFPAQHWSARWINDKFKTLWGSYGIEIENKKIYFAGDTGYSPYFKLIREKWHTPDLAFLPIGSYKPEWFMRDNHMNPTEAVQAHKDLQSHLSIPIHFGTFQLSDEAIDAPINDLQAVLKHQVIPPDDFLILKEGQNILLK